MPLEERFPNKLGHHTLVINCQQPLAMHAPGPYLGYIMYIININIYIYAGSIYKYMHLVQASGIWEAKRSAQPTIWQICIFQNPASVESPGVRQAVTCHMLNRPIVGKANNNHSWLQPLFFADLILGWDRASRKWHEWLIWVVWTCRVWKCPSLVVVKHLRKKSGVCISWQSW